MRPKSRITAAFLALFWAASLAPAQTSGSAEAARERKDQYWIVLLDVSLSSEQRDRSQSDRLGHPGYRLRNEILTMMQTLLAAQREKEQNQQNDFLDVYAFGSQVRHLESLSGQPVRWGDVKLEDAWNGEFPSGIGQRTNYLEAIRKAVEQFKDQHREAKKNLIIISDGELDIGGINRPLRGALEKEELELYRNFLRIDNPLMRWLEANHVAVYTLTLDEELQGPNEGERYQQIGQRLYALRLGGDRPLERALSVVEDASGRVGSDGRLPFSEGPYVMRALADEFGGQARSVRYDNVLDVLWRTVFPDQIVPEELGLHRIVLPPGTHKVIVTGPVDAPVQVKIHGRSAPVTLRYDGAKTRHSFEPPDAESDFTKVNVHPTSQYATWLIESPKLDEVYLNPTEEALRQKFSLVPVNNIRFEWQQGKPPERIVAASAVELDLDLVWVNQPDELGLDEWRQQLSKVPLRASARVALPDAAPIDIPLRVEVAQDTSDRVLRLRGQFNDTRALGTYAVIAQLAVGTPPDDWPLKARPVRFQVLAASPLSKPGRFSLVARLAPPEGELGESVPIPQPGPGEEGAPIDIGTEAPPNLVFEWWGKTEKDGCDAVDQLQVEIPELELVFGPSRDALKGKPLDEGGHRVCYRSMPEQLNESALRTTLTVRAGDGLTSWERQLRFQVPEPRLRRVLRWVGLALLALLLAAALAVALIPGLRRALLDWLDRRRADFPLAVDTPNGQTLVWEPGSGEKRFLVTCDAQGEIHAEVTGRSLRPDEQGFEVRARSADEYLVRHLSGPYWNLKRHAPPRPPTLARPLGPEGEIVTLLELARGARIEVDHKGAAVFIHHRAR